MVSLLPFLKAQAAGKVAPMARRTCKTHEFDQEEFQRRVNEGEDPFEVAHELRAEPAAAERPAATPSRWRRMLGWLAVAALVAGLLGIIFAGYLLWQQMGGIRNEITRVDSKVETVSARMDRLLSDLTPVPDAAPVPASIESRTAGLEVTSDGSEKEFVFVVLTQNGQPVKDCPIRAEIVTGPGEINPKTARTDQSGEFRVYYRSSESTAKEANVRIIADSSLSEDFNITLVMPARAGIEFIPDPLTANPSSVQPGGTIVLHFQLHGTTPTPAQNVVVDCTVDQPQFLKVAPADQNPEMRWEQVGQGEKVSVAIRLMTTGETPATDITVSVTCSAQAENGEGPVSRSEHVLVQSSPSVQKPTVEIAVDPITLPADGKSRSVVTVRLLAPDKSLVREAVPFTMTISPVTAGTFSPSPWKTVEGIGELEFIAGTVPGQAEIRVIVSETVFATSTVSLDPAQSAASRVQLRQIAHLWREPSYADSNDVVIFQMLVGTELEKLGQSEAGWERVAVTLWLPTSKVSIADGGLSGVIAGGSPADVSVDSGGVLRPNGTLYATGQDVRLSIVDRESHAGYVGVRIEGWVMQTAINFQ